MILRRSIVLLDELVLWLLLFIGISFDCGNIDENKFIYNNIMNEGRDSLQKTNKKRIKEKKREEKKRIWFSYVFGFERFET